ncbi:unnamed protein product, partial [marine sediment metagenome]
HSSRILQGSNSYNNAGPRMIYTHPIMGFRHLLKK